MPGLSSGSAVGLPGAGRVDLNESWRLGPEESLGKLYSPAPLDDKVQTDFVPLRHLPASGDRKEKQPAKPGAYTGVTPPGQT
jgi:hypothetical protein